MSSGMFGWDRIHEASRSQATLLIAELERIADDLVIRIESAGRGHAVAERKELEEVRGYVRRLSESYLSKGA